MSQLDDIHYSRYETISAVREFYTFRSKMYIDDSDILEPPEGGWPHMENLRCMGKTDEVMELLRRLPYLCNKHPEAEDGTTPLAPGSVWFRPNEPWGSLRQAAEPIELVEEDVIPPSVVGLTYNRWRDGKYFYWIPSEASCTDAPYEWSPENEQEWRENYPAWAVADLFAILRQQFEDLNLVPLGPRNVAEVVIIDDDNREVITAVQDVYRQHGWPDLAAYQKEDCLRAVRKLVREDFPEHIKRFQGEDYED
ncbi:uncharacterized protein PG986_003689 [Apiospora aurea]|uniref:Uncharacterized protein n=1 Tax=Apiospora aurea TaxID=335848 RepID=A0ABR1QT10_9PEZI